MSLHTENKEIARKFTIKPASRILVNTGGTMGGTGLTTGLPIALTLGCGTMGGSSVSENVGPKHLINIKKLVYGTIDADKVVAEDKIFRKYHPEEYHDSLPEYNKHESKYFEYSTGCNSCKSPEERQKSNFKETGEINLEELKAMVDSFVNAFKGE